MIALGQVLIKTPFQSEDQQRVNGTEWSRQCGTLAGELEQPRVPGCCGGSAVV